MSLALYQSRVRSSDLLGGDSLTDELLALGGASTEMTISLAQSGHTGLSGHFQPLNAKLRLAFWRFRSLWIP
jgi:hypothetical protein